MSEAPKRCIHEVGTTVLETRRFNGAIYRRRECVVCGCKTVTVEVMARDGRMPSGLQAGRKRSNRVPTWAELGIALRSGPAAKTTR